jgi:ATP-binding protein involved in chromosome partitioning
MEETMETFEVKKMKTNPMDNKISISAKNIIAVASGKGGVGKSTVSVNLALALVAKGKKVGVLDADIYGPNVPLMLGVKGEKATSDGSKIIPIKKHGLEIMSVGFITEENKALIWRGPLANKLIEQFLGDVAWGELDYLIIDLPPGTGDVPLSIIQKLNLTGAVIVTTPQEAAIADVVKMINMFETTKNTILGIVENMKYITCPDSQTKVELFPRSDDSDFSGFKYETISIFPFIPGIGNKDKDGIPFYLRNREHETSKEYDDLATKVMSV